MGISITPQTNLYQAYKTAVNATNATKSMAAAEKVSAGSSTDFSEMLTDAMNSIDSTSAETKSSENAFLTGEADSIHSVTIAAEKADIALQLTLQVRNKVLDAYQEIMRMQI